MYKRSKIHPQTWKCFTNQQKNNLTKWFVWHSESLFILCVARKGIPSCVLFRGLVRNGIPRFCIYFGSTERNSELCSLPQKGSEQNNGILLLFLFYETEFRVVFSSAEGLGTEFRDFLFRGTTGIPPEITICSVYSVFRGIIFLSEIPNHSCQGVLLVPSPFLFRSPATTGLQICLTSRPHAYRSGGSPVEAEQIRLPHLLKPLGVYRLYTDFTVYSSLYMCVNSCWKYLITTVQHTLSYYTKVYSCIRFHTTPALYGFGRFVQKTEQNCLRLSCECSLARGAAGSRRGEQRSNYFVEELIILLKLLPGKYVK